MSSGTQGLAKSLQRATGCTRPGRFVFFGNARPRVHGFTAQIVVGTDVHLETFEGGKRLRDDCPSGQLDPIVMARADQGLGRLGTEMTSYLPLFR